MTIKNWPPDERPREKLLGHGGMVLSDAELLAFSSAAVVVDRTR